jgi:hypothetical protein
VADQLERLEHEAHVAPAQRGALVLVELEQVLAVSRTVPVLGRSSPASRPSSVDLPDPDAPTMASVSPRRDGKRDVVQNRQRTGRVGYGLS